MRFMNIQIATEDEIIQCCREAVDATVRDYPEHWVAFAAKCLVSGPCYSVWDADDLVCCIGIHIVREGVGNAWAVFHRQTGLRDASGVRGILWLVQNGCEILTERFGLRSLRTFSTQCPSSASRLLKRTGFKQLRHETKTRHFYRWAG